MTNMLRRSARQVIAIIVVLSLALCPVYVVANGGSVQPSLGIQLFLKIITYDENFHENYKGVRAYIIYSKAETDSYKQYVAVRDFFKKNSNLNVSGTAVELIPVEFKQVDSMMSNLNSEYYNVMIITDLDKDKAELIVDRKIEKDIRSFSFDPEFVSLGVAVSVKPESKKNSIFINLEAALIEGSQYGAHLLRMCEIYEGARLSQK
jgi:hypothetical protein